jgi:integrase
VIAHVKT